MAKVLLILEVSQKQAYIFSGKGLRDNIIRSANIAKATSDAWFLEKAPQLYRTAENMVYSGGGHTVLQFSSREAAQAFARCITAAALRDFPGMEMFAKITDYDDNATPSQNLKNLIAELEWKKSLRSGSFRFLSMGVEKLNSENWQPGAYPEIGKATDVVDAEEDWIYPHDFSEVAGNDNFIAIVHADGNAMGTKVDRITGSFGVGEWDLCCKALQLFSKNIDNKFKKALKQVEFTLITHLHNTAKTDLAGNRILPMRPVIQAGDDVCFVCSGQLGLSCAEVFLKALAADTSMGSCEDLPKTIVDQMADSMSYHACAGVAIVHTSYPFAKAYELSEELCSSAKKLGSRIDPFGTVSAMDWHIEFGQLQDTLADTRRDYITEDGHALALRPILVDAPAALRQKADVITCGVRTWDFVHALIRAYQNKENGLARGKLKNLRTALKQGEVETNYYLADRQIAQVLDEVFHAKYRTESEQLEQWRAMLSTGTKYTYDAFPVIDGVKRCLLFDAIEMTDHFIEMEVAFDE